MSRQCLLLPVISGGPACCIKISAGSPKKHPFIFRLHYHLLALRLNFSQGLLHISNLVVRHDWLSVFPTNHSQALARITTHSRYALKKKKRSRVTARWVLARRRVMTGGGVQAGVVRVAKRWSSWTASHGADAGHRTLVWQKSCSIVVKDRVLTN